jgi:hypothetical protein
MIFARRKWVLVAGAAALLSSQAAWAVPVNTAPAVDPLVSVSLLGSEQSRAAVCGAGAACALPASMGAAATSPAVLGTAASAAAAQGPDQPGYGLDWPGLIVMFAVPVAIILAIALEGNGNNNNEPVSPS